MFLGRTLRRASLATAITCGLLGSQAHAATFTWSGLAGGNDFWQNGANWVGGTPTFNNETDLIFTGAAGVRSNTILSANRTVRSVTFDAAMSIPFSIRTRSGAIASAGPANLTFSSSVDNSSITVEDGASAAIIESRAVSGAGASGSVILNSNLDVIHNGANLLTIGDAHSYISGPGSINKSGPGTLILGGNNTYLGDTTITSGIVQLGIETAIPDGPTSGDVSVMDTAILDLNGFSETINGLAGTGIVDNTSEVTATLSVGTNNATSTFAGTIQNTGFLLNLTKVGAGNLTLTGNNTFAGSTTITAGRVVGVVGGSAANSGVIIDSESAASRTSIPDNTLQWTYAELTANAAGALEFAFASTAPSTTVAPLVISGAADFNATPTILVTGNNFSVGTFPLMTWGSTSGAAPSAVTLPPGVTGNVEVSGTTLNLVVSSVTIALAKANNTDDLNLPSSWTTGAVPSASEIAPWNSTVTSENSTLLGADTTWAGIKISDPIGLVTIGGGNTLTLGAAAIDIDMAAATEDLTVETPLVVGDANVWDIGVGQKLTLGNQVSGSAAIIKKGAGAVTLSGANTFSGGLELNAGVLNLNSGTALGATESTFTIGGGSSLDNTSGSEIFLENNNPQMWNADFTFIGANNLDLGSGAVTLGESREVTVFANTLTVGGAIDGDGLSLTKEGDGALVLNGDNFITDSLNLNAGILTLGGANAFGGGVFVNSLSTLNINHPSALGTSYLVLGGSSTVGNNSDADIILANEHYQEWNGNFTFAGPNGLDLGTGSVLLSGNRVVTVAASELTVNGVIDGINTGLTKSGIGTLILNAENTFTGQLIITGGGAGVLRASTIADAGVQSSLGAATGNNSFIQLGTISGPGNLEFVGTAAASTNRGFQIGQNGPSGAGGTILNNSESPEHTLTFTNPAFNRAAQFVASSSPHDRTLVFSGSNTGVNEVQGTIITNAGTNVGINNGILSISKNGTGTWKFSGVNSYTGNTSIIQGTLILGGSTVIPDGPGKGNLIVDGILDMNSNSETVNGLSGFGTIDTLTGGTPTLTVGANDQSGEFFGVIQNTMGSLSLRKVGSGSLTLGGFNTYSGDTFVNEGVLVVNGESIADSSTNRLIITGGMVQLDGNETVDTLYYGGQPQPAGTYGSSGSIADPPVDFVDDERFSGTGILTVTREGTLLGFYAWISGAFANGTVPSDQQGLDDDPDGDGFSNLMEYALADLDPTVPDIAPGTMTGTTLSFNKRQPVATELTYMIEESTDLGIVDPWTDAGATDNETTISHTPADGLDANFMRLKIIQP